MGLLPDPVAEVGAVVGGAKDILGMFFPDKTEEEKAKIAAALALQQDQNKLVELQAQANANSANQPGMHFRDGAGWVCVVGMAVTVLKPLIEWGSRIVNHPLDLPPVDTTTTSTMLTALLGLGAFHAAPAAINAFKGN